MVTNSPGLLEVFKSHTSLSEKTIIFFLVLVFSATSVQMLSMQILFKDPLIICTDPNTNLTFSCTEVEACTNTYPFMIDKVNGPQSFSAEYELICENSSQKRLTLTLSFLGFLVAAIFQILIMVDYKNRKSLICISGFGMTIAYILMLLSNCFGFSFNIIGFLFFINGFFLIYINTFTYIYASQNIKGEVSGIVIIFMTVTWALVGIFYTIVGYLTNANWQILIICSCSLTFICAFLVFITKQIPNEIKKEEIIEEEEIVGEEQFSTLSYFRDMWPNLTIRRNFLIYTFVWSIFFVVYIVQYVELESVGGSVYTNTILCCVLEICSAFFAGYLTRKYSCEKILKFSVTMVAIFFLMFIFAPISLTSASGFQTFFFGACLLIGKFNNDMVNLMIYLNLPKMFTDKYVGLYLILSRGSNRFIMILVPTLNYFIRSFSIHPFVFYGVIYVICRFLLNYCHEVETEGLDTLMNDVNMGIVKRITVISASHSMTGSVSHNDILKKVMVNGVSLSLIRKGHQNPGSIRLNSNLMNLETPLLKGISFMKENKKQSLYELKQSLKGKA